MDKSPHNLEAAITQIPAGWYLSQLWITDHSKWRAMLMTDEPPWHTVTSHMGAQAGGSNMMAGAVLLAISEIGGVNDISSE